MIVVRSVGRKEEDEMRIREWPKEEEKKKEKGLFDGMEEGGKPFRVIL